jgi:hypothetical protein
MLFFLQHKRRACTESNILPAIYGLTFNVENNTLPKLTTSVTCDQDIRTHGFITTTDESVKNILRKIRTGFLGSYCTVLYTGLCGFLITPK